MLLPISRSPVRLTMRRRCSGSKANTATSICSMTVRSSAVASTAPSRCSCSVSASAFISISASPSGSSGLAVRPRIEKSSSRKRREQVGERLQRHDDARADRRREAEQRAEDDDRQGPLHLRRVGSVQRIHSAVTAPGTPAPSARRKTC